MANEPMDSTTPSASNNNITLAPNTTNPAPTPKKSLSPPSNNNITLAPNTTNPAPTPNKSLSPPFKEKKEKLNKPLKKATATLSPPLGQFFITIILQVATFTSAIAFGVFAVKSIHIARTANEYSASANSFSAQALEEARIANQVAMLAVCSQPGAAQNSSFAAFCFRVLNGAPIVMPDAASNLFTKLSTAITTSSVSASIVRSTGFTSSIRSITSNSNVAASTAYPRKNPTHPAQYPVSSSSSVGDNRRITRRITFAIALPISFLFIVMIIAMLIIRSKKISKRSTANLPGEYINEVQEHGYPPTNKLLKQWKERDLFGNWWKTFRAYFLDSTVSTNQEE